jgi:hypothetical protein
MTVADSIKAKLDEAKYVMRRQMARIAELEQECERLRSAAGAHEVLRSIYADSNQPTGHRIKAAGLAIGHEVPRIQSVPPAIDSTCEEVVPLAELVEQRRARQRQLEGRPIEVAPSGAVRVLSHKPGSNGNGNDSDH